ncbi:MAG: helix-turn-helix transcriptional regulator [Acidimicrobiia bacterium]
MGALRAFDEALARIRRLGAVALEALCLTDVSEVVADIGDDRRGGQIAARALVLADAAAGSLPEHLAHLSVAWSEIAFRRPEAAIEPAQQAAQKLREAGYRLHAAIALDVEARALEAVERTAAISVAGAAAEAFHSCGASWRRDRVLGRLTRLGSRGRRTAASVRGPDTLTEREREVAHLAARGFTAKEISERLYIGRRTVETHLQIIYAKLGVGSKRELVGHAERFRDAASPWPVP